MAALEVVYRRLVEKGLGRFCLELHSSKANKKDVLGQLDRSWSERGEETAEHWQAEASRLKERSEEHTSELQSLMRISYAVFCLKKKNNPKQKHIHGTQEHPMNIHEQR